MNLRDEIEKLAFVSYLSRQGRRALGSETLPWALDMAGLGALATPTIHRKLTGKDINDNTYDALELGGLGAIGAGATLHFLKTLRNKHP